MLKIILVFAELERNMTAERVRANMIARAQKGIWNGGKIPLGYYRNEEENNFQIDHSEIQTVKMIFNLYEEYHSCLIVSRFLNQKGIKTKGEKSWSPTTIYSVLTNPFYLGTLRYNRSSASTGRNCEDDWVIISDHHEAAIQPLQFERCQKLLQKQNFKSDTRTCLKKHIHIFSGLLYCDYCGEMMKPFEKDRASDLTFCMQKPKKRELSQPIYLRYHNWSSYFFNFDRNGTFISIGRATLSFTGFLRCTQ